MNRYTVIIPVFNALEHAKRCLESVLRNTPFEHRILVIDDASTDGDTLRYLQNIARFHNFGDRLRFTFNERNCGFVKNANYGINDALAYGTEPILLNSDTIVPPRWIERLDEARTRATELGICVAAVSPLSNCASFYSVPNAFDNDLPDWLDAEEMDRIVETSSSEQFPEIPCAIGFCMLLTRDALNEVGLFDTKWGRGYGEETDWSVRAKEKMFSCILADNLFVWHAHHASFGDEAIELRKEQQEKFLEQYPGFDKVVEAWCLEAKQLQHRLRIADAMWQRRPGLRTRIMFVCHHWGRLGGLEIFQRRLVKELSEVYDVVVVYPSRADMVCDSKVSWIGNALHVAMSPRMVESKIDLGIFPFSLRAERVENWFADCLEALMPDVVHFHHLGGWGTFRLPEIATAFGPTVLSVHDDYYLCPSYLTAGWSCGRDFSEDCQQCRECVENEWTVRVEGRYSEHVPDMLSERQFEIERMFANINRVVFPSSTLMQRYQKHIGELNQETCKRVGVIPHGVPRYPFAETYTPASKIRVAWVGGVLPEKGWNAFANAARQLVSDERFEFSVLGEWHDMADRSGLAHVTFHGKYAPEELPQLLQREDLAIPAVARKEAYGLVVDECLAACCPLLVPDVPTMRLRFGVGGYHSGYYEWGNAESLKAMIEQNINIAKFDRKPRNVGFSSMEECSLRYKKLYAHLLSATDGEP